MVLEVPSLDVASVIQAVTAASIIIVTTAHIILDVVQVQVPLTHIYSSETITAAAAASHGTSFFTVTYHFIATL